MTRNNSPKTWLITQLRFLLSCLTVILPLCCAGQARGETNISGVISVDYTMTLANSPYHVTGDLTIGNATLTIEPGVTITFNGNTSMLVNGTLLAQGTTDAPITFTASAASPVAGSWGNIIVQDGGNATLDHCTIRYAGSRPGYNYGAILKSGLGTLTVTSSTIDTFYTYGIVLNNASGAVTISNTLIDGKNNYYGNHGILVSGQISAANITISGNTITNASTNGILLQNYAAPHINSNTFSNNAKYGILVNSGAAPLLDAANQFTAPALGWEMGFDAASSGVAHTYDTALTAPVVITGGTIASPNSITWSSSRTYVVGVAVTVNSGASLSLAPGSIVKLAGGVSIQVSGTFSAGSDSGARSYLTGFMDTTIGTAIKGVSGAPSAGDWGNIAVNNSGSATIANCDIRYAGNASGYSYGAIIKYGAGELTLTHSTVYSAYAHGVRLQDTTATVAINGNTIQAVGYYGNYGLTLNNAGAGATISGNTISGASAAGILVSGATSAPQIIRNSITGNAIGISATSSANPVIGGSAGKGNNLYNNTTWSVQNATSASPPQINARFNYWGGASGPYHASTNTGGNQTSKVTDNVDYASWSLPTSGSISINSGAAYTTLPDVIIDFSCNDTSGCERIALSNDNLTFAELDFIPSTGWIINEAQGSTTVSVKFRYGSGAWSPVYQAAIILDSIPPDPPVVTGSTPNQGQGLVWNWTSGGGGNGAFRYRMSGDSGWTETSATSFAPSGDLSAGRFNLDVQERDAAGNWSASGSSLVELKGDNWLSTTVNGYGSIKGTSVKGQDYSSDTGPNTASFALNDQITLSATPSTDFAFSGWSGDCTADSGPCTLYMIADRSVTARFTTVKSALLFAPAMSAHDSLGAAYTAAPLDGNVTIMGRDTTFGENLLMDRNVTVTLQGGYEDSFSTVSGLSVVTGTLTVRAGRLNAAGLAVRKQN